ncbi:TANK-binding kinase 1-binding protein 1, partial [Silurus asotus]
MESLLREQFGLKGGSESLREEVCGMIRWPPSSLCVDINQFAAAYHEIRLRLAGLERENSSIRKKLKNYEMKFPMISLCEDERSMCCTCESQKVELIQTENSNLQQRINNLLEELQKSKAHEQRLEEVIKAYEKIHLEKSTVQKELDNMTTLAEQHVERIRKLEMALGQRESLLQKKKTRESSHQRNKETRYLHLYTSLDTPCALECPGPSLQSSRSLDTLTDLKLQCLEAELEGLWHEARGACQREEELKAELQHLQEEIRQEKERQELDVECEHCSVEWIKKAGDEQVNLALAYTELLEELSRIRRLIAEQNRILRQKRSSTGPNSPEHSHKHTHAHTHTAHKQHTNTHNTNLQTTHTHKHTTHTHIYRHITQHTHIHTCTHTHTYTHNRHMHTYIHIHTTHTVYTHTQHTNTCTIHTYTVLRHGPASTSSDPTHPHTRSMRLHFQGRRSYSDMADPSVSPHVVHNPISTLPKRRTASHAHLKPISTGPRPSSAHGALELNFQPDSSPAPLATPHQSSEDEDDEWAGLRIMTPPHSHFRSEHAQSWPSIKLWMKEEESDTRSCPLCQLSFPTGFPDDALITHIDTHLENSKI